MPRHFTAEFSSYALFELGRRPSTVDAYLTRLRTWETWFGKPWWEITSDDVREFIRARPYRSQTLKGMVTALRQAHVWGALEGYWKQNGICKVKVPKLDDQDDIPPLSLSVVARIRKACRRPLDYRLVYLGLYCGMRIGESAAFEGPMWDFAERLIRFKGEKNGRPREIPVHEDLEEVKFMVLASLPTDESTLQRVKRRLASRSGVTFRSQQLRKTFATTLYDKGTPWEVIQDLLGHTTGVTGVYTVIPRSRKREAIARLAY